MSLIICSTKILWEDNGILGLGPKGEKAYGRRDFLELSVFLPPPRFSPLLKN